MLAAAALAASVLNKLAKLHEHVDVIRPALCAGGRRSP